MGLFRKLGRQIEQFKQTAKEEAEASEVYRCSACNEEFSTRPERCPECGAERIEAESETAESEE